MYLIEHKNSLYKVSEDFFKTKNKLSKDLFENYKLAQTAYIYAGFYYQKRNLNLIKAFNKWH